jgi:1-acyl-sn-glycerol-3-phosphate acyltransferase
LRKAWRHFLVVLAQLTRNLADGCWIALVFLRLLAGGKEELQAALIVAAVGLAPVLFPAPLIVAIGQTRSQRWLLVGSAALCLGLVFLFGDPLDTSMVSLFLLATSSAVFRATSRSYFPAGAQVSQRSLTLLHAASAMCGTLGLWLVWLFVFVWKLYAVDVALVANVVTLLLVCPVPSLADLPRSKRWRSAFSEMSRDCLRIRQQRSAWGSARGHGAYLALSSVGTVLVLAYSADQEAISNLVLHLVLGALSGVVLVSLQLHRFRGLGLLFFAAVGLIVAFCWLALGGSPPWPCFFLGISAVLATVPQRSFFQQVVPSDTLGNGMALFQANAALCVLVLAGGLAALARWAFPESQAAPYWFLALAALFALIATVRILYRHIVELILELLMWPVYRVRGAGPGLEAFPATGPVLVVANHCAWFDPIWLGKVIPRELTPMMTSLFYDLPVIHFLMKRIVGAIRVPVASFRREAPELQEAVRVLDSGGVLTIFPEAMLKRREEQFLRKFGQGIWHILKERPSTPVVACWIEGGWRSFTSYYNGPPTVNKRWDWWWRMRIGVSAPVTLADKVLADQQTTRNCLMQACLNARQHLGLPTLLVAEACGLVPTGKEESREEAEPDGEAG